MHLYFIELIKNMHLTLNSHTCKCTIRHIHSPETFNQSNKATGSFGNNTATKSISDPKCPSMFFGNCFDKDDHDDSVQHQIIENGKNIELSEKQKLTNKAPPNSSSRKKISLSLRQSQIQFKTPKKYSLNTSKEKDSTNKKLRTCDGRQQHNKAQNIRMFCPSHGSKIKTEPTTAQKKGLINVNQMRESLKPSTFLSSNVATSAKKSSNNSAQKVKLTITNNYKSQIDYQNNRNISQNQQQLFKQNQNQGIQDDVFIEESFMTAKLANIYGQINRSQEANFPNSNIVYYNQIMAHESLWKAQPSFQQHQPSRHTILKKEINFSKEDRSILRDISGFESYLNDKKSFDRQSYLNDKKSDLNHKKSQPQLNAKKQQQSNDNQSQRQFLQNQSQSNFKSRFKERKFIGQYAKTIKTFNQSELKSDHESVVLEHIHFGQGLQQYFPSVSFNRGSIKEQIREGQSDAYKRQYSSFGGEEQHQQSSQLERGRFRQYVSHPIEESSLDSEKQN